VQPSSSFQARRGARRRRDIRGVDERGGTTVRGSRSSALRQVAVTWVGDVQDATRKALKRNAKLDADGLTVESSDGTVTVKGNRASAVGRSTTMAIDAAWGGERRLRHRARPRYRLLLETARKAAARGSPHAARFRAGRMVTPAAGRVLEGIDDFAELVSSYAAARARVASTTTPQRGPQPIQHPRRSAEFRAAPTSARALQLSARGHLVCSLPESAMRSPSVCFYCIVAPAARSGLVCRVFVSSRNLARG